MIYEINFPIEGPLREPLWILEWLIVLFFLELTIIFYIKGKSKEKKLRNQQERAYIMFFLGYALIWMFTIFGDYHAETSEERFLFLNIGLILISLCELIFFYRMEKDQVYLRKFLFTKTFSLFIVIISISMFILNNIITQIIAFIFYTGLLTIFFIMYLIRLRSNTYIQKITKNFRLKIWILFTGLVLLPIGLIFAIDFILNLYGLEYRFIGDILQLIGFFLIFIFFISVPSLTEYNWKDKIDRLFLMVRSGICVYHKFFKEDLEIIDEQTTSAVIKSINILLDELTNKEGISIIKRKSKNFIIQPGKFIIGVIICDEELKSLKILLNTFIERIERLYSNIFSKKWNVDVQVFKPIENMAKEIFLF